MESQDERVEKKRDPNQRFSEYPLEDHCALQLKDGLKQ
jgi:hypothetical protein